MSLLSRKSLAERLLKTKKFRDGFVSARIKQTLALQARAMREERGLSQTQLAKDLGTSQNAIYRLENPGYGKSISGLMKVASFFDVALVVRFERFSGIVDWVSNMDSESILVPSAEKDIRLKRAASGERAPKGDTSRFYRTTHAARESLRRRIVATKEEPAREARILLDFQAPTSQHLGLYAEQHTEQAYGGF